jgi:ClpP class serine protease
MGVYSEYLNGQHSFERLTELRKAQLLTIGNIRQSDVLVYAADQANVAKSTAPIGIDYSDLLPISDQLQNLKGTRVDLILETPGGSGEIAEDIVSLLRQKYEHVGVVVPGLQRALARSSRWRQTRF